MSQPREQPLDPNQQALDDLRERLEREEAAYAESLATVDRRVSFALPAEAVPEARAHLERLNALWETPPLRLGRRWIAALRLWVWDVVAPAFSRQTEFNASLVRLLNARLAEQDRLDAQLRELTQALVRYTQRVLPLADAMDRMASAVATTRAELLLEAFDRRLETLGQTHGGRLKACEERLQGLLAMRDRLETVSEVQKGIRQSLAAGAPPPAVAAAASQAADDAVYTAFENRFRGSREELARRQAGDAERFHGQSPVVDLGCGRGEFLQLLKDAGIEARGVETNANVVRECRAGGLDVVQGDLVDFLRAHDDRSLGGVFAAQVVEHLPPAVLLALLAEAHRALRPGGLLLLETVNARSATAFFEVYIRDLTHQKPLHSETLAFLAAAQGFTDVRIETRAPIPAAGRLQAIEAAGLSFDTARILNENFERLNTLLYAPLDFALIARR